MLQRLEQLENPNYDYSSSHDTNTGDEMSEGASEPHTTEFGEVVTEKKAPTIRPAIKNSSASSTPSSSSASGPVTSPKPTKRTTDKPRKSVLIKANDTIASTHHVNAHPTFTNSSNYWGNNTATFSSSTSPNTLPGLTNLNNSTGSSNNHHISGSNNYHHNTGGSSNSNQLFAGINNGSIDGDEEDGGGSGGGGGNKNEEGLGLTPEQKEMFKRKRAGHYNEFKVLQAMRAKMHDEDDDDDDDDDEIENIKSSYPALVRQRSIEKVTSLQPTPITQAVIPPTPVISVNTTMPPAPPATTIHTTTNAVPMEEN